MILAILVAVFAVAAFFSAAGNALLIRALRVYNVLDIPNQRSAHRVPTPRGGGVGLLLGGAVGLKLGDLAGLPLPPAPILWTTAAVAVVGLLDDLFSSLSALFRFAAQIASAVSLVLLVGPIPRFPLPPPLDFDLGPLAIPVTILWLVALTNIFNFLDGMDGYAGSQALLAAAGVVLFWPGRLGLTGAALAGACVGFLWFNWRPARIFMGDVGSTAIGFLLAALPLALPSPDRPSAILAMVLLLWFFLTDGVYTLLRRLWQGERVWQAHSSHIYQRLMQNGISSGRIVLTEMSITAMLVLFWYQFVSRWPNLAFGELLLALLCFTLVYRWSRLTRKRMAEASLDNGKKSGELAVAVGGSSITTKNDLSCVK